MNRSLSNLMFTLMICISIYNRNSQAISNQSHSELSRSIRDLGTDLESKFGSLQTTINLSAERTVSSPQLKALAQMLTCKLKTAIKSAQKVVALASLNKHFYTPQTVSSIFTGRSRELNNLKQYLIVSPSTEPCKTQKRFVVFGLSGSGKTQFCCKFASVNKQRYSPVMQDYNELRLTRLKAFGAFSGLMQALKSTQSNPFLRFQRSERLHQTNVLPKIGFPVSNKSSLGCLSLIMRMTPIFLWTSIFLMVTMGPYL